MQTPTQFSAKLEEKIEHNARYIQYQFELIQPHELSFQAGQYVSLKVSDQGDRRSYSFCSSPGLTHGFELLVDVSPAGLGSQYLQSLQFGDTVSGLAPLGHFTIANIPEQSLVFVATGSGIGPLYSMITDLIQEKQDPRPITLYWGIRHPHEFFWLSDFQDMVEAVERFSFYPVVSQPVEEWTLSTGRVTDLLQVHQFPAETGFYLCGSDRMIADVKQLLIDKQISEQHIHHERFF